MIWGSFVSPFAQAQQAFADIINSESHLKDIVNAAGAKGAVKFLRGEVLTTLRRPPFAAQDLVSVL